MRITTEHRDASSVAHGVGARRIPGLDGLRAISIGMVLVGHLSGTRGFFGLDLVRYTGNLANLGVRVFFVISGFLITGLLLKELDATGGVSLTGFYYRRTLRIFPAFYVFLAIMAFAQALGFITLRPHDLAHALTYTTNYHYDRAWWLGHTWSLSVEEQFYLLWPATLLLLGRRHALYAAASVVAAAPIIRVVMIAAWPGARDAVGEAFPTIADSIATGCLFAALVPSLRSRRDVQRLLTSGWFMVVPFTAVVLNMKAGGRLSAGVFETVINVCIGLCVVRVTTVEGDLIGRILNCAPMAYVGTLSYSLYLWQQPFLNRHSGASLMRFPFNLALAVICAALSYHCVERPCLAFRDRRRTRSSTVVASPSPVTAVARH